MKKFLRLSLVALFATVFNVVSAEDILWSEDFSSYAADDVPTGGTYNYVCADNGTSITKIHAANLATGTSPELLIGKSAGSFSATIPMNGKSGELTLTFLANNGNLAVTATNATVGAKVAAGNSYTYPITVEAGTESVTILFSNTSSKNVRFDNVKLYQGTALLPAGLTWGTSAREVTLGAEDNKFPTLTNPYGVRVEYSSDNAGVATIDAETGVITLVAAGVANISARFEGDAQYEASEATYKLTVKEPADPSVDISNTIETAYTVAKAHELIAANQGLETAVYVKGIITNIKEVSTKFGNATYSINDNDTYDQATALVLFRGLYAENVKFTSADQIKVGDIVVVYGKLVDYNGTKEMNSGNYIVLINGMSGVENVAAENAPVEYFNLQGVRVANPENGLFIRRQGNTVSKVVIR